ncbi:hypothetical protein L208DRAFT_1304310, partial [Tricholoma matsutake]
QVEQAFAAFLSGTYIEPQLFAHKHYWHAIRVFLGHVECISERHWGLVLASQNGADDDMGDDLHTDASMISAYREDFYIPLSPQKP